MKIKELHLRNIASIECADIDFSKDLADQVTGQPVSVFLISGDTGAGKSVILDGISMALYNNTPRLSSVANSVKNQFSDASGEIISVSSIEQYTRLGISEKEDSYSELIFEGNDHVEYRAKLVLGMMLGNKDKTTGKRSLKHRTPKWKLKVGTADWIDSKTSVEKAILSAIGLSFEQFCRMSMLAQGQFAAFLTGAKKERESILEQLTNTEHFTSYGMAIKSLFDTAKKAFNEAQIKYDTEKDHVLPQEDIDRLTLQKAQLEEQKTKVGAQLNAVQDKISLVQNLEQWHKALKDTSDIKAGIERTMAGQEYKESELLVKDWEATMEARQKLEDMRGAIAEKKTASENLASLGKTFRKLYADLLSRREKAAQKSIEAASLQAWLKERQDRDALYSETGAVEVHINNYVKDLQDLSANESRTSQEKEKTPQLAQKYDSAAKEAERAASAEKTKEEEIDKLASKRKELKPEQVNKDLDAAKERKSLLGGIKTVLESLASDKKGAEELKGTIQVEEAAYQDLINKANDAQENYNKAKVIDDNNRSALNTMEMSLDEKLVELRRSLVSQQVETCPLCGQHISSSILDDQSFKEIITPLQQLQQKSSEELKEAQEKLDDANRNLHSKKGSINTLKESYDLAIKKIADKEEELACDAEQAGFDSSVDMAQIEKAIAEEKAKIDRLAQIQKEAEAIQDSINVCLDEKKKLDAIKESAEEEARKANSNLDNNAREIKTLEEKHAELKQNIASLAQNIAKAVGQWYPDWVEDPEQTCYTLKKEAAEYSSVKNSLADANTKLDATNRLIQTIESHVSAIYGIHADWERAEEPCGCNSADIVKDWISLVSEAQKFDGLISDNDKKIRDGAKILEDYYACSGKKESDLDLITSKKDEVDPARNLIKNTSAELKSRTDAIADCQEKIANAMQKLGAQNEDEVPVLQNLEIEKVILSEKLSETDSSLGVIQEKLAQDSENKESLKNAEDALEKAKETHQKWDKLNSLFGGTRFRTLVQTYILRPLLNNANIYLERITDRYSLTCSEDNEQLSILVLDRYNKNQVRSATVLSGGEKFMISLALSLALSTLNHPDMNVDILFIDEGFGTLDEKNLDSVMQTLEKLQEIAGEKQRRVGIISHREELCERIPVQIRVLKKGEGRSRIEIQNG